MEHTMKSLLLFFLSVALMLALSGCSTEISSGTIVTKTHEISESFTAISVECSECNISLLPSSDSRVTVVCKEREKYPHRVSVENGCLTVEEPDRTALGDVLSLIGSHTEIKVYLPAEVVTGCRLSLESASGDIVLDKGFTFAEGDIDAASGSVTCSASFTGSLSVDNASGDVVLQGNSYGDIDIDNASGGILLEELADVGSIELECASGNINLNKVRCKSLEAEAASGKLTLEDVIAREEIMGETVSGSITLRRCDAGEFDLESASGNIEGSVLRPMRFVTECLSGTAKVPDTDGDLCKLTTYSGNIHITIEE